MSKSAGFHHIPALAGRKLVLVCLASAGLAASSMSARAADDGSKSNMRVTAAETKAAPKPVLRPTTTPIAEAAAEPVAAAPQEQSLLGGAWKINWLRQNKATSITISAERGQPGIVGFDGALVSLAGTECKGGGFAAKTLGGVFPTGGDVNMVGVADYVRIITQCASGQVWLEALGVAGKPLQWVGRAVMIDASGGRVFESFVMTR